MPGDATFVVGVDLAAMTASQLFRDNRQALGVEITVLAEAAASCGLGYEDLQRVTLGFDTKANGFAMVLTVDGIGRDDAFSCMRDAIPRPDGTASWAKVADGNRERFVLSDGRAAWVVDECTVVIAASPWIDRVRPLLDGDGRSVLTSTLEPTIRRSSITSHVWFAGVVPSEFLQGAVSKGDVDVSGSVDLSSGLKFATRLGFIDATMASAKANEFRAMFDGLEMMLANNGVPKAMLDRVQIDSLGPTVVIAGSATSEELTTVGELLRKK